MTDIGNMLNH